MNIVALLSALLLGVIATSLILGYFANKVALKKDEEIAQLRTELKTVKRDLEISQNTVSEMPVMTNQYIWAKNPNNAIYARIEWGSNEVDPMLWEVINAYSNRQTEQNLMALRSILQIVSNKKVDALKAKAETPKPE